MPSGAGPGGVAALSGGGWSSALSAPLPRPKKGKPPPPKYARPPYASAAATRHPRVPVTSQNRRPRRGEAGLAAGFGAALAALSLARGDKCFFLIFMAAPGVVAKGF